MEVNINILNQWLTNRPLELQNLNIILDNSSGEGLDQTAIITECFLPNDNNTKTQIDISIIEQYYSEYSSSLL